MYEPGKSDSPVLPAKLPNKATKVVEEAVEGRGLAKGNVASQTRPGRRAGGDAPSGLDRVREAARRDRNTRFTALLLQSPAPRWPNLSQKDRRAGRRPAD